MPHMSFEMLLQFLCIKWSISWKSNNAKRRNRSSFDFNDLYYTYVYKSLRDWGMIWIYKLFNYLIILFHCFKENCPDGDSDPGGAGPWPRGAA